MRISDSRSIKPHLVNLISDFLILGKDILPEAVTLNDKLLQYLTTNRLLPLVFYILHKNAFVIDGSHIKVLRDAYNSSIANFLIVEDQYRRIKKALKNIQYIVFKGISASSTLYPLPYLRPQGDIDIIVQEDAINTCIELLEKHGYKMVKKPDPSSEYTLPILPKHREGLLVDIHMDMKRRDMRKIPFRELLDNAYPTEHGLFLKPPALLVSLTVHAHLHWFILPLINWLDIALMVNKMDSKEIYQAYELARRWGFERAFVYSTGIACELWGISPPHLPRVVSTKTSIKILNIISAIKSGFISKVSKALTFYIFMERDMKTYYIIERALYYIKDITR